MQFSAALKARFCLQVCDPWYHKVLHENIQCCSSRKSLSPGPAGLAPADPAVQFLAGAQAVPSRALEILLQAVCRAHLLWGEPGKHHRVHFAASAPSSACFLCSPPACLPLPCIKHCSCCCQPFHTPWAFYGSSLSKLPAFHPPWQASPFLEEHRGGMGKWAFISLFRHSSPKGWKLAE